MEERIEKVERFVNEKMVREEGNFFIAIIVGVLLLIIALILIFGFDLTTNQTIVFIVFIIVFYIVVLSFLFEHKLIREIINNITRTEENPVYLKSQNKEITKEIIKRVDKPVIYEVEKPIIRNVITPIDRMVFMKREKLNIPRYDYIGSSETKNYHKKSCRLGKLIKKKYKLLNNDPKFFIKRGFSPCKVCILKEKKV